MLITTHVLVGALLGTTLARRPSTPGNVASAGVLGVASHFACDAVPHWGLSGAAGARDREFLKVAVPDGVVGLALLGVVVGRAPRRHRAVVAAATLGACLPDTDKIGRFAFGASPWPDWLDDWHGRIQRESHRRLPSDIVKAAILAAVLLSRSPT